MWTVSLEFTRSVPVQVLPIVKVGEAVKVTFTGKLLSCATVIDALFPSVAGNPFIKMR